MPARTAGAVIAERAANSAVNSLKTIDMSAEISLIASSKFVTAGTSSSLFEVCSKVKPWLEDLEGLAVVQATGNDRAEDRREHVTRDTQPVGPRPILPGLVHQALANIENDSADHASYPTAARTAG